MGLAVASGRQSESNGVPSLRCTARLGMRFFVDADATGCSYDGPNSGATNSMGCLVDKEGRWERCKVVCFSDLSFCDVELRAAAADPHKSAGAEAF